MGKNIEKGGMPKKLLLNKGGRREGFQGNRRGTRIQGEEKRTKIWGTPPPWVRVSKKKKEKRQKGK